MSNIAQRPTKEVELPITKAKVIFKEWLTKAEAEKVKAPMLRHNIEISNKGVNDLQHISAETITEVEHLTIQEAVISINGLTDKILETCLEFPESDFDFLKNEIDSSISPPKGQKE